MTPEEHFQKIDNALGAMAEHRAVDDARIRRIDEQIERIDEQLERLHGQLEKNTEGIRDLIRVSGTLVEHQFALDQKTTGTAQKLDERLSKLIDTVDRMGANIDKLSDTVDRFLKGSGGPNGQH